MRHWIAAAVLVSMPIASSAQATDVLQSVLQITFEHNGQQYVYEDGIVPLLPGNVCYTWYVQIPDGDAPVSVVERFTLPVALSDWAAGGTPGENSVIEDGGRVAVTSFTATSSVDGWFSHGWCAAEGDPLGRHTIRVTANGTVAGDFGFTVVDPADYNFPQPESVLPPPSARSRSAADSW